MAIDRCEALDLIKAEPDTAAAIYGFERRNSGAFLRHADKVVIASLLAGAVLAVVALVVAPGEFWGVFLGGLVGGVTGGAGAMGLELLRDRDERDIQAAALFGYVDVGGNLVPLARAVADEVAALRASSAATDLGSPGSPSAKLSAAADAKLQRLTGPPTPSVLGQAP